MYKRRCANGLTPRPVFTTTTRALSRAFRPQTGWRRRQVTKGCARFSIRLHCSAVADLFDGGLRACPPPTTGMPIEYIDVSGQTAIPAVFDDALCFSEGLAAVEIGMYGDGQTRTGRKWGFIDKRGRFIIPPRFDLAFSFFEGLAQASKTAGEWGFIDKRGAFAIPPVYSETDAFSDGLALVWRTDEDRASYIDRVGKRVLTPANPALWSFSDGLTIVGSCGEQKYIDKRGRVIADYDTPETHAGRRKN
jgi:hypothetical protein